jgi:hypothetical protein
MSVDLELQRQQASGEPFAYRALSSAAVSSLAMGVLSSLALFDWWLAVIPLCAVVAGCIALRAIARQNDQLTGAWFARVGMALAVLFFVVGWSRLGYIYATEVPDGYQRISYAELQPDPDVAGQIIPPEALALDGKQVFIKGFVYPGTRQSGIRQFLLVRDQGSCCFGGNPKLTDRIEVTLSDPKGIEFSSGLFKIAGVFRVESSTAAIDAGGGVYYHIDQGMSR